jgi:hypothetical protein
MAKTSYQLIPPEYDLIYSKVLQSGDRYTIPRVNVKRLFMSRARLKGLTQNSLIPEVATLWDSMSQGLRDDWTEAGARCNLTGYKLLLQDTAHRRRNLLAGYSVPSVLHQSRVGKIRIDEPASGIKIAQLHPLTYYKLRKVRGTRDQYEPIEIIETLRLPLKIELSFKTELTSAGADPSASFYAEILSHYQGQNIITVLKIDLGLNENWKRESATISNVLGMVRGYNLFFEIKDARGVLYFDNLNAEHSGQNWARDPFCNAIKTAFTGAFHQVPKHWINIDVPEGAFFDSFYYNNIT